MTPVLRILGTRGVPAAHGGFETFAEQLALHLVARGWRVVVYCQEDGDGALREDCWRGVERIIIPVRQAGPAGTVVFDWRATRHAARERDLCLTLGYNTALFCARLRLARVTNLINMDGIEWSRAKWGPVAKLWFRFNEWAGAKLGDHLVADHPEIARHLERHVPPEAITTIPYGAADLRSVPEAPVRALGLDPGRYLTVIARPEPENSLVEIVEGFSRRPRGTTLAVLGRYDEAHPYHRAVRAAAGPEVRFLGAIYDPAVVQALRFQSLAYVHGHRVGGTNPSLVEALGAGNPVLAHDNRFNRWVAGPDALYFTDAASFDTALARLLDSEALRAAMAASSRHAFQSRFTWAEVLARYEALLTRFLPDAA